MVESGPLCSTSLFRVHNGKGPTQDFQDEMMALWKGFSRTINKRKIQARRLAVEQEEGNPDDNGQEESGSGSDISDEDDDDDWGKFKEGKDPMLPKP
jgi:hypothetical protein